MNGRNAGVLIGCLLIVFCLLVLWMQGVWLHSSGEGPAGEASGPEAVMDNYGAAIRKFARKEGVAPEYLAALCMLECSGRKPAGTRYEKHVYLRLKLVKSGFKGQYEHVKKEDLTDAGDDALQNLASSWGPFQLMGYKCLLYQINVSDLRGEDAIMWGVRWIMANYGRYLKSNDFKSAFHIHNAGVPFPKNGKPRTHDPEYVNKGLKWMNYFKGRFD